MAHVIPGTPSRGRDLVLGFIAGALAVVTFHQGMVLILSSVGLIQSRVYAMRGVPPFGVRLYSLRFPGPEGGPGPSGEDPSRARNAGQDDL